nr:biotin/lipoyl-binding carrier protein [Geodermatophilus sabuli]
MPASSPGCRTRACRTTPRRSARCSTGWPPAPAHPRADRLAGPAGPPSPRAWIDRRSAREVPVAVEEIQAEMVSSVWKVLVQPGSQVAAGDTLVILESMKMEIPVLTERAGTVRELHVVEGEVLQEGDLIATVDG